MFLFLLTLIATAQAKQPATPQETEVMVAITNVDEIDPVAQNFSASVYYLARWHDPNLAGKNPEPVVTEMSKIWNPNIVVMNQQQAWKNYPESAEISPDGAVTYRQSLWGKFTQSLDLHDFPLDHQTLTIQMSNTVQAPMKSFSAGEIPQSGISKKFSVPDFEIMSWRAAPIHYAPAEGMTEMPGYELRVEIRRRLSYYVLKFLFPLCLIIAVSWIPRWIDPKYFVANVGLASTAFLTQVAYILSINMLLPKMAYLTRMDRFVLLSIGLVFISVIQTVAVGMLYDRKPELAKLIEYRTRLIYPAALVVILAGAFVV
jgi:hypothetical protein